MLVAVRVAIIIVAMLVTIIADCIIFEAAIILLKLSLEFCEQTCQKYYVATAGNEALHWLTTANNLKHYELRVDLADFNGTSRYAKYAAFKIGSADLKYQLMSLGAYSGNAGAWMAYAEQ